MNVMIQLSLLLSWLLPTMISRWTFTIPLDLETYKVASVNICLNSLNKNIQNKY
jgi:hypothetical protein